MVFTEVLSAVGIGGSASNFVEIIAIGLSLWKIVDVAKAALTKTQAAQ